MRGRAALTAIVVAAAVAGCGGEEPAPPPSPPAAAGPAVALQQVAEAEQPIDLIALPGSEQLLVAEKTGRVRVLSPDGTLADEPFLDLSDRVATGGEQGLLGIAFAPDGARLYAHYSDEEGDGRLASWAVADGAADPGTEIQLMRVEQPYGNHNGGQIAFGPDGHLYWGLGDGGSAGDPEQRAQELGSLLGKILRIRPTPGGAEPFIVPTDNPFYGREGAQPAIWVYGLRNPWRFAFDRDGGLWIGDVGQGDIEEIDYLPAGEQAGANLGWDRLEGTRPFEGEAPPDAVPPVFEYSHDVGISVTGGVVYEGAAIPGLAGAYLFGDYGSGFVSALVQDGGRWVEQRLPVEVPSLAAFGVDASGEVYLLSLEGPIYRLVPAGA